jgi:hypothetical protein
MTPPTRHDCPSPEEYQALAVDMLAGVRRAIKAGTGCSVCQGKLLLWLTRAALEVTDETSRGNSVVRPMAETLLPLAHLGPSRWPAAPSGGTP